MATCATVLNETLTSVSTYTSDHLTVGSYTELTYDFFITELTGDALIIISRVSPAGDLTQIYGSNRPAASAPITPDTGDVGSSWGYSSNFTFGDTIQVDITVTGGVISGRLCLQGKG